MLGGGDLKYYTSYFQMCDAAQHEGDVEAVTVFHQPEQRQAHGDRNDAARRQRLYAVGEQRVESGTHPIAYSAWASHAMYTTPGRKIAGRHDRYGRAGQYSAGSFISPAGTSTICPQPMGNDGMPKLYGFILS